MNTVDMLAYLIKSGRHEEAIHAINELVEIACSLEAENEEMRARIKEAPVPRTVEGDGSDLPVDTVVIDKNGDAWQHYEANGWEPIGGCCCMHHTLPDDGVPYTIVWTPEENAND